MAMCPTLVSNRLRRIEEKVLCMALPKRSPKRSHAARRTEGAANHAVVLLRTVLSARRHRS